MNKDISGAVIFDGVYYDNVLLLQLINEMKGILQNNCNLSEDTVIALLLDRNIDMISVVISLYEMEIVFVPIDISLPVERVKQMLQIVNPNYVLTCKKYENLICNRECVLVDELKKKKHYIHQEKRYKSKTAYIIFTSGTSGRPKAVEILRKGIINLFKFIPQNIDCSLINICASFSNYSFDIFYLETLLMLYWGKTVVLSTHEEQVNPYKMIRLINRESIDTIQLTPSRLRMLMLVDKELGCLAKVKNLLVGGEKFPEEILSILQKNETLNIYNMYGPTETTIWSMVSNVSLQGEVNLGEPIGNTRIYLLNENLNHVIPGEEGEIHIGGDGLAKGYYCDEKLTDKSFVFLPFYPFERVYKTGDMAVYDEKKRLIYLGRNDEQIKKNGYRIELEDIDLNVGNVSMIKSAITCFDQEKNILITFYISEGNIEEKEIQRQVKNLLPGYMLPKRYVKVEGYLFTGSGKVDRKKMLNDWKEGEYGNKK